MSHKNNSAIIKNNHNCDVQSYDEIYTTFQKLCICNIFLVKSNYYHIDMMHYIDYN